MNVAPLAEMACTARCAPARLPSVASQSGTTTCEEVPKVMTVKSASRGRRSMQRRAAWRAASILPMMFMEEDVSSTMPTARRATAAPASPSAVTVRMASSRRTPGARCGLKKLSSLNCMIPCPRAPRPSAQAERSGAASAACTTRSPAAARPST